MVTGNRTKRNETKRQKDSVRTRGMRVGSLWTTRTPEAPRPKRVEVWGITCKCAPNAQHVHPAGAAGDPGGLPAILLPFPAELSPSGAGGGESLVPQAGDSRMTARGGPGQAGGGRVFAGRPGPLQPSGFSAGTPDAVKESRGSSGAAIHCRSERSSKHGSARSW